MTLREASREITVRSGMGRRPATDEPLQARIAELEQRNAALERFSAHAAHELVEPLVMIEAYVAMVTERLDDGEEENRHDLEVLSRGIARTRILVESILHQARARNNRLDLEEVDLQRVVGDCLDLLAPEIACRRANVVVTDLPVVHGDTAQLGSVLNNLIINALKYGSRDDGAIRIRSERDGAFWRIHVESQGRTLASEDRARVFSAFSRARGERRARGAGLGLAICRDIIERHGGSIGVAPVNGSGNSFYFTLPA